jgi:glyoxylase-like metal-dependent hydrolase (beta-lactamase superfamily II)
MPAPRVVDVDTNVFCATGTDVNWILLREGDEVTLIDSGYPGDAATVEASVRAIGSRPEAVRAILLTHAHIDHLGSVNHFHARYGTPVYASAVEVPHARREYLEQVTPALVARQCWRPGVLPWALRAALAGGVRSGAAAHVRPFPCDGPLDLPGSPEPIATAGHTAGHTAYLLPGTGALATGDALVTGHPTARLSGPQILPSMFNHCTGAEALATLSEVAHLDVGVIVPGHGAPLRAPIPKAIALATDNAASPRYW